MNKYVIIYLIFMPIIMVALVYTLFYAVIKTIW